ncbi:MAG: sodium:calcium symporter, partial [Chthoniobacterales bacterium]
LFTFVIKYISPVYLLVVFAAWAWQDIGSRLDDFSESAAVRWSLIFLAGVFVLFLWWIRLAVKRWKAQEVQS